MDESRILLALADGSVKTPRLAQIFVREGIITEKDDLYHLVSAGTNGVVVILGTRFSDLHENVISINCEELTDMLLIPNRINVIY